VEVGLQPDQDLAGHQDASLGHPQAVAVPLQHAGRQQLVQGRPDGSLHVNPKSAL